MSPEEKKLEKLSKLFEIVNEDYATPDDLIKLTETILSIITSEREKLQSNIAENKGIIDTSSATTLQKLTATSDRLESLIQNLSKVTDSKLNTATTQLSKEIKRVEKKIPTKTVLTDIYTQIDAINEGLNDLPTEFTTNNEAIRDGLELLQGDERLDKSAIKGLDDYDELLRLAKSPKEIVGAGVRLLRYLQDVNIEGITNGQTLIWNTTLQRFEAGSGGTGGGHTIQDEGTPLTQRANINFVGANVNVTDDAGNDATVVTISGGGSGTVNTIVAGNNIDVDATDPANPIVSVETLTLADISDVTASITELNYIDGVTSAIQTQLNGKAPSLGADDNYVTDAEKAALHAAVTVTDSTSIDITLTGQDITVQREALTGAITAPKNSNTTSLGSFTTAQFNTALSDNDVATGGGTATGTNTGDQTSIVGITGTKAQFDTAVTDGNILYVGDVTQYTDELAQDAVGAMVATSIVYNDAGATLQRAALTGAITASQDSNATALGSFTVAQLNTAISDANVIPEAGGTFTGDISVPDEAYGVGWNGSLEVPTKNALYDKIETISGGATTNINTVYIDQAGGTSDTYGALSGARNGSNTVFTVSQSVYATGTLKVWRNGQLQTQGSSEDFVETAPASGIFTVAVAPASTDEITVEYQKVTTSAASFDELAQDAIGTILTDSSEIDFTYNDGVPSITASIVAGSIDETKLDVSTNASLDLADSALQSAAIGVTVQGYDADLAAIAALTPSNDDFVQRKAGAWTNRTVAQVKTDLGLTGTNSGDQTSIVGITGTKAQFDTAVTDGNIMYVGDAPTAHTHLLAAGATDVTATAAELNILDGATLSVTELNYVDGVTSAIQTQINAKPTISSGAGAPASTPTKVGDIYIDTTGDDAYIAVGTASSADWEKSNDGAGGGISDGDKGDITVSASGATWTVDANAITFAKMQAITDGVLLGASGGTAVEEITIGAGLSLAGNTLSATGGGGGTNLGLVIATATGYNMV